MANLKELLKGEPSQVIGYMDFGPEEQHPLELVAIADGLVDVYATISGVHTLATSAWDGRENIEDLADYLGHPVVLS